MFMIVIQFLIWYYDPRINKNSKKSHSWITARKRGSWIIRSLSPAFRAERVLPWSVVESVSQPQRPTCPNQSWMTGSYPWTQNIPVYARTSWGVWAEGEGGRGVGGNHIWKGIGGLLVSLNCARKQSHYNWLKWRCFASPQVLAPSRGIPSNKSPSRHASHRLASTTSWTPHSLTISPFLLKLEHRVSLKKMSHMPV